VVGNLSVCAADCNGQGLAAIADPTEGFLVSFSPIPKAIGRRRRNMKLQAPTALPLQFGYRRRMPVIESVKR